MSADAVRPFWVGICQKAVSVCMGIWMDGCRRCTGFGSVGFGKITHLALDFASGRGRRRTCECKQDTNCCDTVGFELTLARFVYFSGACKCPNLCSSNNSKSLNLRDGFVSKQSTNSMLVTTLAWAPGRSIHIQRQQRWASTLSKDTCLVLPVLNLLSNVFRDFFRVMSSVRPFHSAIHFLEVVGDA